MVYALYFSKKITSRLRELGVVKLTVLCKSGSRRVSGSYRGIRIMDIYKDLCYNDVKQTKAVVYY